MEKGKKRGNSYWDEAVGRGDGKKEIMKGESNERNCKKN